MAHDATAMITAVATNPLSCLVTGAYGLLGGWLVQALLDRGDRVTVLRRDRTPRSMLSLLDLERQVTVVDGDIRDGSLLDRVLGEHEVDTVLHLAAQTLVPTANSSPSATFETNIGGTWTVLEAVRRHGVPRTVVASSDKAYGPHDELPYREDMALQPRYPYDVSKAATDLLARSYWHTYGVPVAVTRCANLYGGGDMNRSRLVPEVVAALLDRRAPVIRSDGSPERDFLYVEDAVAAYLAVVGLLRDGRGAGEAFNVGTDRPVSVRDLVATACRVADTSVEPDIRGDGTPGGEIDRQFLDSSKLQQATGWAPKVTLEDGLRRTIDWYATYGA